MTAFRRTSFTPQRQLTPAQYRIVATLYHGNLCDYASVALETATSPHTVKMHIERIARWLPGDGPPLVRVALYAERLLETCGLAEGGVTRIAS